MSDNRRRIRMTRSHEKASQGEVNTAYVQRVVLETLQGMGLDDFPQWKGEVQRQLHVVRVILSDIRQSVVLATLNDGSAKNKLDELLEQMGIAMVNLDEILTDDDRGPSERQQHAQDLLARFRQHDPRYDDPTGSDVETDDFNDPLEEML